MIRMADRPNAYHAEFTARVRMATGVFLPRGVVANTGAAGGAGGSFVHSFLPRRPDVRLALEAGREVLFDLTARTGHVGSYARPFVVRAYDLFYGFLLP